MATRYHLFQLLMRSMASQRCSMLPLAYVLRSKLMAPGTVVNGSAVVKSGALMDGGMSTTKRVERPMAPVAMETMRMPLLMKSRMKARRTRLSRRTSGTRLTRCLSMCLYSIPRDRVPQTDALFS